MVLQTWYLATISLKMNELSLSRQRKLTVFSDYDKIQTLK